VEEGPKNIVHQRLKGGRRIAQTKGHDQELEVPVVRAERRLVDVLGVHAHLVVARAKVQLGEVLGAVEFIE